MNSLDSNSSNAALSQLLVALADFQQQQSDFARQQQESSLRIENCLRELSQSLQTQASGRKGGENTKTDIENPGVSGSIGSTPALAKPTDSAETTQARQEPTVNSEVARANVTDGAIQAIETSLAADTNQTRQSGQVKQLDPETESSLYKTASPKVESPYKTLEQEKASSPAGSLYKTQPKVTTTVSIAPVQSGGPQERQLSQSVSHTEPAHPGVGSGPAMVEANEDSPMAGSTKGNSPIVTEETATEAITTTTDQKIQPSAGTATSAPTVRSPYRTLQQEQEQCQDERPQVDVSSRSKLTVAESNLKASGAVVEKQPTAQVEDPALRDPVKEIEQLLPTVDQFTNELLDASDQQLKEASVTDAFEPRKTKPVKSTRLSKPVKHLRPKYEDMEEAGDKDEDSLTSVREAIAMDATDERSLLDQIHRFTETLSESTSFWKQVTIPQADMEPQTPAKSLDPTASIAAQYENSSRSPYSH